MSIHSFNTARQITTNAEVQALFQGLSNGIRKAGLTRVAGSHAALATGTFAGASDFSTLTTTGATNTILAWEIWRFSDALHGAISKTVLPVYIFLTYGSGNVATSPRITGTIGFALNNDVAPTGLIGNTYATGNLDFAGGHASATVNECFVSGDTNRLLIVTYASSSAVSVSQIIGVERLHNPDGSDNAEGVFCFHGNPNAATTPSNQVLSNPYVTGNGPNPGFMTCVWPTSNVTAYGADFHTTLCYPIRGRLLPPSRNVALVNYTDLPVTNQVTLNYYGANHVFYSAHGPRWSSVALSGATAIFLLRYE